MHDKRLLHQKIAEILKQLRHIEKLLRLPARELFAQESTFYFAERVMERLIGAAIDINMHLVADLSGETPKDYFSSFLALAKYRILPLAFAKRIAPSTTLRNILVHEYQNIDEKKFIDALKRASKEYARYIKYIDSWLEKA